MPTAHSTAIEDIVNEKLFDAEYARTLATYLKNIKTGKYDQLLVDAVFQKSWQEGQPNIYDAYAFAVIYSGLYGGTLASCSIPIGSAPGRDRNLSGNNEKLAALPEGFSAQFDPDRGRGASSDGRISWDFELGANSTRVLDGDEHENLKVWIGPGSAPLEVGTTAASRTLLHIMQDGRVCRWPYDSEDALLIFKIDSAHSKIETLNRTPCACRAA